MKKIILTVGLCLLLISPFVNIHEVKASEESNARHIYKVENINVIEFIPRTNLGYTCVGIRYGVRVALECFPRGEL